jgi:antitoxin ParD1/3/4
MKWSLLMAEMHIQVSAENDAFIQEQIATGKFATPDELITSLVEENRTKIARERVDALLIEGLESGPLIEITPEYGRQTSDELARKHAALEKALDSLDKRLQRVGEVLRPIVTEIVATVGENPEPSPAHKDD